MAKRHFPDWITAYVDYTKYSEAPTRMHFWTAVSAVSGALRRRVWIDQSYFKWYCNLYVILVAPPGIVSKSTTVGIGMNLLRQVPGPKFGPDIVTWPALVQCFGDATEGVEAEGAINMMSPLTLESSELGNLLNPQDKQMVDLLVSLWDGKTGNFRKKTKGNGDDAVENPWINLIACTTPAWIAGNFPEYLIGGGLTSRCIFVYADTKAKLVAYPGRNVPKDLKETERKLTEDLAEISKLFGEYILSEEALEWGEDWYSRIYEKRPVHLDSDRFGSYIARKQTHLHKVAMILAASQSDSLLIQREHLELASMMLTDLEPDMAQVFSLVGKSQQSQYVDRLLEYVRSTGGASYVDVYRFVHVHFPRARDFEDVIAGCVGSGLIKLTRQGAEMMVLPAEELKG